MAGLLTVIIKATRECNLRCSYCSDWRSQSPHISESLVDQIVSSAFEVSGFSGVHFNWHGGEPTLIPLSLFEHAVRRQAAICPAQKRFTNTLQTNGTLLRPEWLEFLTENGFAVGVSVDGPPEFHDRMRPTAGGKGSSRQVREGLGRLAAYGIPFGVTVVASDELIVLGADYLWRYLVSSGISNVNIVPVRPPNLPGGVLRSPTISAEFAALTEWSAFIGRLFDLWWDSGSTIRISDFDAILRKLIGRNSSSCLIAGGCLGTVFGIEPDGTIMHCELFQGEATHSFGNISDTSFTDVIASERLQGLREFNQRRLAGYRSCPTFDLCAGGCPWEWHIHEQYGRLQDIAECCGWRDLIERISARTENEVSRARVLQQGAAGAQPTETTH